MTGIDWLGPFILALLFALTCMVLFIVALEGDVEGNRRWTWLVLPMMLGFIGLGVAATVFAFWLGTS